MAWNRVFWRRCWNRHFWRLASLDKLSITQTLQNTRNVRFVEAKRLFCFAFKYAKADFHKLVVFISQNGRPDEKKGQQDNHDEARLNIVRGFRSSWICYLCVSMRINRERIGISSHLPGGVSIWIRTGSNVPIKWFLCRPTCYRDPVIFSYTSLLETHAHY